MLAEKRAEFIELFREFADSYPPTSKGQSHLEHYEEERKEGKKNFEAILQVEGRGEDITEKVLMKLLPYEDTKANREMNYWISIAPVFKVDVKKRFEAAGWTKPEDWPKVANAILRFVRRCNDHPEELKIACDEFSDSPYSKGFQAGTLTPILHALRPDDFILINNKSRRAVNYFTGTSYSSSLADYPVINEMAGSLIDEISDDISKFEISGIRDDDLFDMFTHWLVAIKKYDFNGETPEAIQSGLDAEELSEPFIKICEKIFRNTREAEWAFDLLKMTIERLGIESLDDERFSITIPIRSGGKSLHLIFGPWLVLGFSGSADQTSNRVSIALLANETILDKRFVSFNFAQKDDEPDIRIYTIPIEMIMASKDDILKSYDDTLNYIANKFKDWKSSPWRNKHHSKIAEAVFDQRKILDELIFPPKPPIYTITQCAEDTGFDLATLEHWVRAIRRKRQAVLYGPPGTGKTYVAEHLAKHLIGGGDGFMDLVQFHPAYAYEDFIQGIRPQSDEDGGLKYPLVPGRFLEFCKRADSRQGTCVLIIDEINRANLSQVFGELMYLLEYREREIPLAGGGTLRIPGNVLIIGTMNTADRSIALVDHALRRRFAFLRLQPNHDVLRKYHQNRDTGFPVEGLIGVLRRLNNQISDPHYEVGISFFLRENLADEIEDIWKMEIEPYMDEYFFDRPEKADDFRWDKVVREIMP